MSDLSQLSAAMRTLTMRINLPKVKHGTDQPLCNGALSPSEVDETSMN
jgi:hypothetical protein